MSISHAEQVGELHKSSTLKVVEVAKAYLTLTKPRIAILLLFTAFAAMIVAAQGIPTLRQMVLGLVGLGLSAGGAAAINMWYDRDIDAVMTRTAKRPLPSGVVSPGQALTFGLLLGVASVVLLATTVNWLAAILSGAGYVYYAVIYTMLLKRRTPQNIVIGGGAGAFPPLVGWAVVTGHLSLMAVLMFVVIFLWTPSHFWGLALYKNEDYTRAGVPMMPVAKGSRSTKRQMVAYAVLLLAASLALTPVMRAEILYTVLAGIFGLGFLLVNIRLLSEPDDEHRWSKRTFFASLLYLPAMFTVMAICALA
ncbi:protoheme IX farnesyltransferase [Alicyclobacillus cycloheptanicus]|uniref:Protoheme IX farnesyltransferase n=1 Tax=Alicyclobacillus cycloheptanicus TaxID=1457 RepID=A0ABT9XL64_9BACL|nr:heme o synthase [Alicyclobacillus cycloheptanicus]MDQ0191051.1 protoheme IX farnesyltransferase [Alicyclobacillus cycloheptanicus]WDM00847.1 protoheme IX farnesyltransferase [Alicyclobacillus cycloheptanicus]